MSEAERIEVPEETLESDTPPEAEAAAATLEITQPDAEAAPKPIPAKATFALTFIRMHA